MFSRRALARLPRACAARRCAPLRRVRHPRGGPGAPLIVDKGNGAAQLRRAPQTLRSGTPDTHTHARDRGSGQFAGMANLLAMYTDCESAMARVRSAATVLDDAQLGAEVDAWISLALDFVQAMPLVWHDDGDVAPFEEHRDLIWGQMCQLSWLGSEFCHLTLMPTTMGSARRCVAKLVFCMVRVGPIGDGPIGDANVYKGWEDLCVHQKRYCFPLPFEGDAEASLFMLLGRCASYNHGDVEWYQIQDYLQDNVDYTHRLLERILLLVASVGRFACIDSEWHQLANDATFRTSEEYNMQLTTRRILYALRYPLDKPCVNDELLKPLKNPYARKMVGAMHLVYRLAEIHGDGDHDARATEAYREGLEHINAVKKTFYRGRFHKWRTLWTIAMYWQEQTAKRQCDTGGAWRAADLAVIAEMGVAELTLTESDSDARVDHGRARCA